MLDRILNVFRNRYFFPKEHIHWRNEAQRVPIMRMRERRIQIVWTCLLMFLINLIFFNVLWFVSMVNSGGDFTLTFSEMLVISADNRELFLSWYVWYVFMTLIFLAYSVLWEDTEVIENSDKDAVVPIPCCRKRKHLHGTYLFFTACFATFSIWKLVFLILLFSFADTGETKDAHAWMAGLAYLCAIASSVSLYIRRLVVRTQPFIHISILFLLMFNTLVILGQLAMVITFVLTWTGEVEFTLTLLIVLDPIFQVIDHRNHTLCFTTLSNDAAQNVPQPQFLEENRPNDEEKVELKTEPVFIRTGDVSQFVKAIPIEQRQYW